MSGSGDRSDLGPFGRLFESWINPPWRYGLVTLPWVLGATLLVIHAHRDSVRASREQTTMGVIIGHDPGNHDSYQYTYSVAGRTFRAWEPGRANWQMGQQTTVYYDPLDPSESSLVDFSERSVEDAGPIPVLVLGICGILAYIGWQRYHNAPARSRI